MVGYIFFKTLKSFFKSVLLAVALACTPACHAEIFNLSILKDTQREQLVYIFDEVHSCGDEVQFDELATEIKTLTEKTDLLMEGSKTKIIRGDIAEDELKKTFDELINKLPFLAGSFAHGDFSDTLEKKVASNSLVSITTVDLRGPLFSFLFPHKICRCDELYAELKADHETFKRYDIEFFTKMLPLRANVDWKGIQNISRAFQNGYNSFEGATEVSATSEMRSRYLNAMERETKLFKFLTALDLVDIPALINILRPDAAKKIIFIAGSHHCCNIRTYLKSLGYETILDTCDVEATLQKYFNSLDPENPDPTHASFKLPVLTREVFELIHAEKLSALLAKKPHAPTTQSGPVTTDVQPKSDSQKLLKKIHINLNFLERTGCFDSTAWNEMDQQLKIAVIDKKEAEYLHWGFGSSLRNLINKKSDLCITHFSDLEKFAYTVLAKCDPDLKCYSFLKTSIYALHIFAGEKALEAYKFIQQTDLSLSMDSTVLRLLLEKNLALAVPIIFKAFDSMIRSGAITIDSNSFSLLEDLIAREIGLDRITKNLETIVSHYKGSKIPVHEETYNKAKQLLNMIEIQTGHQKQKWQQYMLDREKISGENDI